MSARRGAVVALCLGLALLALPGVAEAKRGFVVVNRNLQTEFAVFDSSGFEIEVETLGHRWVSMRVWHGFDSWVEYATRGRVSRNRIEATFGKVGRIDVRFHGRRRPFPLVHGLDIEPSPDFPRRFRYCRGRKPVREVGEFRGTIRFDGENGFAHIRSRSARGEVRRHFRRVCKPRPGGVGANAFSELFDGLYDSLQTNLLTAVERSRDRFTMFVALGFVDDGANEFFGTSGTALVFEKLEGMRIARVTSVEGDASGLLASAPKKSPVTATVDLPKPFRGSAEFEKAVGSPPRWVGQLRAPLLGVGTVPLTGEGFETTLCRARYEDLLKPRGTRCLRRSGIPLPGPFVVGKAVGAQIKGSQSQAFGDARLSWSR